MPFYAHSLPNEPDRSKWETMAEHEELVAEYCGKFLDRIDPSLKPWGELLGRWHDLGKYHPDFQRKLDGKRVHIEHAGAGARLAFEKDSQKAIPISFSIAGHHAGLANLKLNSQGSGRTPLVDRLSANESLLGAFRDILPNELVDREAPNLPNWIAPNDKSSFKSLDFFTRILFSALVDSDRLATERFYDVANRRKQRTEKLKYDSIRSLRDRVDRSIDRLCEKAGNNPSEVNRFRKSVLDSCRDAMKSPTGLFSLTVPTGGGKTLSALSFALNHAVEHQLDRVIIVIPYTSIIRQNANAYRKALGSENSPDWRNVVEHHSGIDEQKAMSESLETREAETLRRIAVENWDAPIVVTTAVQFFESLFTDHPSQARKLHRIAKSAVILDEVQTLPPSLLTPILDGISELATNYGTTVVLSTATPPSLAQRDDFPQGLNSIQPIIKDAKSLAASKAARRVKVEWRVDSETTFETLANEIKALSERQALVVVHRRKDALALARLLPESDRIHLSAQMCPAHRIGAIEKINHRLASGKPCLVVSTQLIEAGVDIDLPIVYRALAGLDSLAQAAGRCDREGHRTEDLGQPAGKLVAFLAETTPPTEALRKAMGWTIQLYKEKQEEGVELDIFDPEHCNEFFARFYSSESLDAKDIQQSRSSLNFNDVGSKFRMIENDWSFPIVAPWPMLGDERGEGTRRAEAFREAPSRDTARALQPYIVQVPKKVAWQLELEGIVTIDEGSIGLPTDMFDANWYSEEFGLSFETPSETTNAFFTE